MLNLPLLTKKSTDRFPKVGKKDKSMHNEIRAFYAHMALTHECRFVRCFCLDSENIASDITFIIKKIHSSLIFLRPSQNLCGFILFNTRNFMYNSSNKSTRNKIEDFYARRAARRVCRYFGNIASDSSCIRTSSASFASIGCRIRFHSRGRKASE